MLVTNMDELYTFVGKRIISKKEFAKKLGISANTLRAYLKDTGKIPYETLLKMDSIIAEYKA